MKSKIIIISIFLATLIFVLFGCPKKQTTSLSLDVAAKKVYVPPGKYDEFYGFLSGGFSGNLMIYGIPSGRLFKIIPVFSVYPENGYGFSEETKALLMTSHGFIPWDDYHHPELSQTNGEVDGRWVFGNSNNTPRIARTDLKTFTTMEIIEIPNSGGNHASPFTTANTEYVVAATRFSVPVPQKDVPISSYKENFKGVLTFVKVEPQTGRMSIEFQLLVPGFNYDLAHCGKGPSKDWCFFTSYNSEQTNTLLEVNASKNDKDYIIAVNYKIAEKCVAEGKAQTWQIEYYHNYYDEKKHMAVSEVKKEVRVLLPKDCPGVAYYLPTPKSPHGVDVDPTGEYIIGGGKLATVIPVHSFSKMLKAIENKEFVGEIEGIPVIKYESVIAGEVQNPCLGPLHTEFDGRGFAYTSCFVSSEVVKWTLPNNEKKLEPFKVVDRVPAYYSVGHIMIPGGDSKKPWGKYLIIMNKITKDRALPTGPELPQSAQLVDISGDKMVFLYEFPTLGEPHYAQGASFELISKNQAKIYPLNENQHPYAVKTEKDAKVVRTGPYRVDIYMTAIRSHFTPDNIEGIQVGDSVYFHVTNLEQDWDIPHGFTVYGAENAELLIMPGETRTLKWIAKKVGVYPFYCTDFCSALHQEMQGYIRVSPRGSNIQISYSTGK